MQNLRELIESASRKAGSDAALAKLIDVAAPNVTMWKHGKKPCPPGDVALMAEIAGLDVGDWTLRAVAAKYEGTAKGEMLMQALKIGSSAVDPARKALEVMVNQLDDMPEAKAGILAVLTAFPPEHEKLKSSFKGTWTRPASSRFFFAHAFRSKSVGSRCSSIPSVLRRCPS